MLLVLDAPSVVGYTQAQGSFVFAHVAPAAPEKAAYLCSGLDPYKSGGLIMTPLILSS